MYIKNLNATDEKCTLNFTNIAGICITKYSKHSFCIFVALKLDAEYDHIDFVLCYLMTPANVKEFLALLMYIPFKRYPRARRTR